MPDKRLKQFEKSLKEKIDELNDSADRIERESLNRYGRHSTTSLNYEKESKGYQGALNMLYEAYPELKKT